MYQIKKVKRSILGALSVLVGLAFLLQNCTDYDTNTLEELQQSAVESLKNGNAKNKIAICHYDIDEGRWFVIHVNENAWEGHQSHGDVRLDDQDNDGFVPYNECGYGQQGDCDDTDELINPRNDKMEIARAVLMVQAANLPEVLTYFTDDVEYHDAIIDFNGIDNMTLFLNNLLSEASPSLVATIEDETFIDDIYSATWTMNGDFFGIPYEAKGISIIKFLPDCSNKVYYWRDYYTEGDIMATIPGLDEAINGFRMYYKCAVDPTYTCPFALPPSTTASVSAGVQNQISADQLVAGRQLVEVHAQNWFEVLPYLQPDYEYHDPIVDIYGPATMAEFLGRLFVGTSNLYTIVEEETIVDDIYMATWTMSGTFNGAPFNAPGMSIVKFVPGTTQTYYSRDYYTEGDVMLGVPELAPAVIGFRQFYRAGVDPTFP